MARDLHPSWLGGRLGVGEMFVSAHVVGVVLVGLVGHWFFAESFVGGCCLYRWCLCNGCSPQDSSQLFSNVHDEFPKFMTLTRKASPQKSPHPRALTETPSD